MKRSNTCSLHIIWRSLELQYTCFVTAGTLGNVFDSEIIKGFRSCSWSVVKCSQRKYCHFLFTIYQTWKLHKIIYHWPPTCCSEPCGHLQGRNIQRWIHWRISNEIIEVSEIIHSYKMTFIGTHSFKIWRWAVKFCLQLNKILRKGEV